MNNILKRIDKSISHEHFYLKLQLTFTSRIIAGWAITGVGLVKLWVTNDPTAWLPVVLGGTGIMIVSRGMDRYMQNENEKVIGNIQVQEDAFKNSFQNSNIPEAVKKHKEYQAYLNNV